MALDRNADDPRPYIERARPTHPSLIDSEHVLADLYHIINVPTVIWIDEGGRMVRPNDSQFGTDTFVQFHGKRSAPFLAAVRAWVREGRGVVPADQMRPQQLLPSPESQLARAEFTLAWHLHRAGRTQAAERHFLRAGELAPHDWTIRRGSMPIRGINPMGPEFFKLYEEWKAAGAPGYPVRPLEES
ncbi:MAG TPA: thioredoxin family protein [Deltaproteobacteria bacterium]|nr:thioredoxin family protein [Deltaproteobacteria bacterium]